MDRVLGSPRYRNVDRSLVSRLAVEELSKARSADDAVKRVKRRLHQAVGAFRQGSRMASAPWPADPEALRSACLEAMRRHASTRERLLFLERFHASVWELTGVPASILDLGCGLHPLALPWMGIGPATYTAVDADTGTLAIVAGFLEAAGQPHRTESRDLARAAPMGHADSADVALLLKLVTTLDRQDGAAATRLLQSLRVRHAVVSFAARSLGGRSGRERAYRDRLERLAADSGRVRAIAEASVPGELVFILELAAPHG